MTTKLEDYKGLTATQRKQINKNELLALLDEAIDENSIITKLDVIINQLKQMQEKNESQDKEIERLEGIIKTQGKILSDHQKFMEGLDAEKRAKDIIVLGLKEEEGQDDSEKFLEIVDTVGVKRTDVEVSCVARLGKIDEEQIDEDKTRPLKVTLEERAMRDMILRNSKNLKDLPETSQFKRVFLKRDQHPEVRKEEKRLYEVFKAEKKKPENADLPVLFDRRNRVVTVNNEEVDRFKLFSSFL